MREDLSLEMPGSDGGMACTQAGCPTTDPSQQMSPAPTLSPAPGPTLSPDPSAVSWEAEGSLVLAAGEHAEARAVKPQPWLPQLDPSPGLGL